MKLPCSNYAALLPPTHSALLPRLLVSCRYLVFTVFHFIWFVLLPLHSCNSDIFGSFVLFLQHLSHHPSCSFLLPSQINCHSVSAHLCENFRQFSVHLIKCFFLRFYLLDCTVEQMVKYGDKFSIHLSGVNPPITLEYRPRATEARETFR